MTDKAHLTASVDRHLLELARAAVRSGRAPSLSAWVNDALRLKTERERRLDALGEFVAAAEAEGGPITGDEVAEASRRARARAVVVRGKPQSTAPARRRRTRPA